MDDEAAASQSPPPQCWPGRWRWAISALVLLHLTAVIAAPFHFASRSGAGSASPFSGAIVNLLRPYIQAAYLDHGYFYFAPNPGPSHLVRYEVLSEQGRVVEKGIFPNLREQQPRLLYHRHFMLAEWLHFHFEPPLEERESEEAGRAATRSAARRRMIYDLGKRSYERHLSSMFGRRVRIVRVEHRQPTPAEAAQGMTLGDRRLYRDLLDAPPSPDQRVRRAGRPAPTPEAIPPGEAR